MYVLIKFPDVSFLKSSGKEREGSEGERINLLLDKKTFWYVNCILSLPSSKEYRVGQKQVYGCEYLLLVLVSTYFCPTLMLPEGGPGPERVCLEPASSGRVLAFMYRVYNTSPVSYTHLTLPTRRDSCRSRWSPYH